MLWQNWAYQFVGSALTDVIHAGHRWQGRKMSVSSEGQAAVHDRAMLLHGSKRNKILTLAEVQQYGIDSFKQVSSASRSLNKHSTALQGPSAYDQCHRSESSCQGAVHT